MSDWPEPIAQVALHGPAGEFVELIEPHTEADPIALLIQLLVAFGVAAGRHAHLRIEASHHYPNEFCVLVGASEKGRKGSSWDHVEHLLGAADRAFVAARLVSGLSSGEGLIAEVRDPLDDNDTTAPADKRLLVQEPEFAQVMKVLAREGTHSLKRALTHARTRGELSFDPEARERYSDIYEQLSAPQPGMFGAATGRAEAHAIRLALIYALLDSSPVITRAHLDAALALWRYARDSTRWVFGESLGDPTADDIWALAKERANGISRTEVRDLFSRNKKAREIDRALTTPVDAGRLQRQPGIEPSTGRRAEIWIPLQQTA